MSVLSDTKKPLYAIGIVRIFWLRCVKTGGLYVLWLKLGT